MLGDRGVPGGETDKSNPENGTGEAAAFQWEKKKENIEDSPWKVAEIDRWIEREKEREPGKPPFDLSAIESLGFTSC